MNERIKELAVEAKELAEQAYEDVIKNTPSFLVTKELYEQKFAELIVKECATLAFDGPNGILEHFGVEE